MPGKSLGCLPGDDYGNRGESNPELGLRLILRFDIIPAI
jgi:hypothetical protein